MAIKKIVKVWDEGELLLENIKFLKDKTKNLFFPLTDSSLNILNDLLDTYQKTPCAGIAANQLGYDKSVFIGIKELIPFFKLSGKGSIINIGSLASLKGSASSPAYTASKTGLIGLTKSTAVAFAKDKIRCNLVCPGHVDTNFIRNDSEYSPNDWNTSINNPENYNQRLSQIPLGRLQTPQDIANLSTFLASEDSNMITGSIIAVDGGVTI